MAVASEASGKLRMELGFVFQQFNLYPHKTALENVTLAPIHVRKLPKAKKPSAGAGAPWKGRPGGQV
jgi:polar amino acid transport system ATP-binding protein